MVDLSDRIRESILHAITELNEMRPDDSQIERSSDANIAGLDSLAKVNFIVFIEQEIEEKFGCMITLADAALVQEQGRDPFESVSSMVDAVHSLVSDDNQSQIT